MARENLVILVGKVMKIPMVYQNDDGTFELNFPISVLRRNNRVDAPDISVEGVTEDVAKRLYMQLQVGKYVLVKGVIVTTMKPLRIKCGECGNIKEVTTLQTEVVSVGEPIVLNGDYIPEQFKEVSNIVNIIGRVCNKPINRSTLGNTSITQYQIAVDRKYHLKEKDGKTDFPWVKSFGKQADEDATRLDRNSVVYVNGSFQTRNTNKTVMCDECARQLSYSETVGEIVSNDVEYLSNYKSDDNSDVQE